MGMANMHTDNCRAMQIGREGEKSSDGRDSCLGKSAVGVIRQSSRVDLRGASARDFECTVLRAKTYKYPNPCSHSAHTVLDLSLCALHRPLSPIQLRSSILTSRDWHCLTSDCRSVLEDFCCSDQCTVLIFIMHAPRSHSLPIPYDFLVRHRPVHRFHISPSAAASDALGSQGRIFLLPTSASTCVRQEQVQNFWVESSPLPSPSSSMVSCIGLRRFFLRFCFRSNSSTSGSLVYPVRAPPV